MNGYSGELRLNLIGIAVLLAVGWFMIHVGPTNVQGNTVKTDSNEFLYPIQLGEKWGFIDQSGRIRILPRFDEVGHFSEGLAGVAGPKRVFSCTNKTLQALIDSIAQTEPDLPFTIEETGMGIDITSSRDSTTHQWQSVKDVTTNYRVLVSGLIGYIDTTGAVVIPMQFAQAGLFSGGVASINLHGNWGLVRRTGNTKIDSLWLDMGPFSEGKAAVLVGEKCGYIDSGGTLVIEPRFDGAHEFDEGLAGVKIGNTWGFIDTSGTPVIPATFERVKRFREGFVAAMQDGRWGFVNRFGTTVIEFKYNNAGNFSEGLAWVETEDGFGFIDRKDEFVIPPQYHGVSDFSEGLAAVGVYNEAKSKIKWGFIDKTGILVVTATYDKVRAFQHGLAAVTDERGLCYIDRTGTLVWVPPNCYDSS